MNKKGQINPTVAIVLVVVIIIALVTFYVVWRASGDPFKSSSEILFNETKEALNTSETNISLSNLNPSANPSDKCGNLRGYSIQNTELHGKVGTWELYPGYYECLGADCCSSYVYEHVLDFGDIQEDKLVKLDFYIQNIVKVNIAANMCMPPFTNCCPDGTSLKGMSGGNLECTIGDPYDLLFYFSETGKPSDWKKFYQARYSSPGKHEIMLPVGNFKFIKVLSIKAYLDYINGEVAPWEYSDQRYLTMCNEFYPKKTGYNFLYNLDTGTPVTELTDLNKNQGYVITVSQEGVWSS